MKSLPKSLIAERAALANAVRVKATTLNASIAAYNAMLENVAGDMTMHLEHRSERWQESEAGKDYAAWRDAYAQMLDEVEIDMPEELAETDLSHADDMDDLPDEP